VTQPGWDIIIIIIIGQGVCGGEQAAPDSHPLCMACIHWTCWWRVCLMLIWFETRDASGTIGPFNHALVHQAPALCA
jgi:hypothetical protein